MSTDIVLPSSTATPARLGQATAVEQSRAVAQVQAAVVVAREYPRSTQHAINEMRDACGRSELAQRAFFKFPRGRETVNGASVYLARELARIWGNIDYGLNEMSRDDEYGQSEMQAYAWDLQTNSRSTRTFIVEHARDTKQGRQKLTDLRDISDNNNNLGARAVREMIFAVLPRWFSDMAEALCRETLTKGGGDPLPVRIDKALTAFSSRFRVTKAQLETRIGRPTDEWTGDDMADLEILFGSLARGEITKDEAFPAEAVTAAEITTGKPTAAPKTKPVAEPEPQPAEITEPTQPGFGDSSEPWIDPVTGETA